MSSLPSSVDTITTPALIVDLDAMDANLKHMKTLLSKFPKLHIRPHAKTHKCAEIAKLQESVFENNNFSGVCCQTVREAEFMVHGGIKNVLLSNEIFSVSKIARVIDLIKTHNASITACVDSKELIERYSKEATAQSVSLPLLVEVNVGSSRCGVERPNEALDLVEKIMTSSGVTFQGLQAYNGTAQHFRTAHERQEAIQKTTNVAFDIIQKLNAKGIKCPTVTGGGTGTFLLEAASGVFTEIQPGSFIFMDVDYGKNLETTQWKNSLFVIGEVISRTESGKRVVVDAGQKSISVDSGLPVVHNLTYRSYRNGGDEHGIIEFEEGQTLPQLGERLWIIPGHCDPTVNMHDFIYGVRRNQVVHKWAICPRDP